MREWIARVMTAAVLSAVLELLAPEGKMRRYVSFGIAAVLLVVLLSPLGGIRDSIALLPPLFDVESESEGEAEAADEAMLSLAETALAEHLAERFALDVSAICPTLSFGEGRRTMQLSLILPKGAPIDEIRAYLESETSLECEVIIE